MKAPTGAPSRWRHRRLGTIAGMDIIDSSRAEVAHVLRRIGFVAHPDAVDQWAGSTAELVETQIADVGVTAPDYDLAGEWEDYELVVGWIVGRFRSRDAGLHERMTWFWHDHFATSIDKVGDVTPMYTQHRILRQHALGNFRELVRAVITDPAMLIYLDGDGSYGEAPNENLARELMELFTLGVGNYTEQDVRGGARALAGWWVDWERWQAHFEPEDAYQGEVDFLGRRGRIDVDDVVDAVCEHPACSRFVAAKLHRQFIGTEPAPDRVEHLAAVFRSSGLEIRPLVAEIVSDPSFLANRNTRLRSPIEWLSAALVASGMDDDVGPWTYEQLGQVPWSPPNVGGWPDGARWGGADQLLRRVDLATWFASEEHLFGADPVADVLQRCSLFEVSPQTRETLQRVAKRTSSASWEQESLLFSLALASPEFALA